MPWVRSGFCFSFIAWDSMTEPHETSVGLLINWYQSEKCLRCFFGPCQANYTPGSGYTVDESLLGFRDRCSFKQYIPKKPGKYGIKVYVKADNMTFYSLCSKVYIDKGTHDPDLPVPTQAILDFIGVVAGTNRNITTDNYYTSISLTNELKSRGLTLVGTMKKNKTCIPPSFLAKSEGG